MLDNFLIEQTPNDYFMIFNKFDSDHFVKLKGSATVIQARLFDLTFANYCRMCRDIYGAKIYGTAPYFKVTFETKSAARPLLNELNKRWTLVEKTLKGL